jgi:exosortase A-associated hydrolase 1
LDEGTATTGLLIVSGGNEIRSGAYGGQATMAAHFAAQGYPVFRYDRRGIGDSEGTNRGFENSADDIASAVAAFRTNAPHISRIVAFGNCDAASALVLFHTQLGVDAYILANPWVIEATADTPTVPTSSAVRARYWARIKNPRSMLDLLTGKIDLKKLAGGLATAARQDTPSGLALRMADALQSTDVAVHLLIASHDTTALAFMGAWHSKSFEHVRPKANITLQTIDTASHSFADARSKLWLLEKISATLA